MSSSVSATERPTPAACALLVDVINHVAVLTLERPRSLNALTHDMVRELSSHLERLAADPDVRAVLLRGSGTRAFCAGGDVIAIAQSARDHSRLSQEFFIDEYHLDLQLHRYPKPSVAVMNGVVMGGGMGLAQACDLRLVTSSTRMAMPETRIGLVPDVGATHFFSRMPAPLAHYLALTGVNLTATDAIFAGLADAHARHEDPQDLVMSLAHLRWPEDRNHDHQALYRHLAADDATRVQGSALLAQCEQIYAHFDPAIEPLEIVKRLERTQQPWARECGATLRSHSPLMLALCSHALRRGRRLALPSCFRMEYGLVQVAIARGELQEGVRAVLIDKDQHPRWSIPSLDQLTAADVEAAWTQAQAFERDMDLPRPLNRST